MNELDPTELVRTLNEQGDFDRFPCRATKGGSASVGYEQTIAMDLCWCGQAKDHDWPGKDDGGPHPRYPR